MEIEGYNLFCMNGHKINETNNMNPRVMSNLELGGGLMTRRSNISQAPCLHDMMAHDARVT